MGRQRKQGMPVPCPGLSCARTTGPRRVEPGYRRLRSRRPGPVTPRTPFPRLLFGLVLAGLLLPLAALATSSGSQRGTHLWLELLSEDSALSPGGDHWLALRITHDPEWHTYWRNPGDSGLPTRIDWQLPEGFRVGPIHWPIPQRLPFGPLTNFGFEGEAWLLNRIRGPADAQPGTAVTLTAEVADLVCKEECIPGRDRLSIELPWAATGTTPEAPHIGFVQARQQLPQPRPDLGSLQADDGSLAAQRRVA